MLNPVRTWKISVCVLVILYACNCGSYLLFVLAGTDRFELKGLLGLLSGMFSAVAFVEVAMSHVRRRRINAVLAGTALTACAVLSVATIAGTVFYLFSSLSAAPNVLILLAMTVGPACCLAAATWIGRGALETGSAPTSGEDGSTG